MRLHRLALLIVVGLVVPLPAAAQNDPAPDELALKRVNERVQIGVRDSLLRESDQRVLRLALASVRLGEQHLRAIE